MTEETTCSLCGGEFHEEPDTEGWMGLLCPGSSATEEEAEQFLSDLAQAFAAHMAEEFEKHNDWINERRDLWYKRERTDVTQEELQANCNQLTDTEVSRQKREEVFQPFGEFEVELPPHLVVRGEPPKGSGISTATSPFQEEDWKLYVGDDPYADS